MDAGDFQGVPTSWYLTIRILYIFTRLTPPQVDILNVQNIWRFLLIGGVDSTFRTRWEVFIIEEVFTIIGKITRESEKEASKCPALTVVTQACHRKLPQ